MNNDYLKSHLAIEGDPDLFTVAYEGKCQVVQFCDYFGNGKTYKSEIFTNPTWKDFVISVIEYNDLTQDFDHTFLEGLSVEKTSDIAIIDLILGS